jgi:DNA sulfur modification protein DndD
MKIDYIDLQNYRQYRNEEIEFNLNSEQDITVVKGDNGAGKSNLLNSVTWALYDEETHIANKNKGLHLPNTKKVSEMEEGDTCEVAVEVEMKDRNGKRHNIERSVSYEKTGPGKVREISGSKDFSYAREAGNDMKVMSNPEHHLNLNLPRDINKYFFFDGEQLNRYFERSSESRIKDAVFNISQLQVLDNTIYHLDQMKSDFLSKKDDLDPEIEDKRKRVEALKQEKEDAEENFENVKSRKEKVSQKVDELREWLKDTPEAGEIQEEIENLEREKKRLEEELDQDLREKMDSVVREGSFVLSEDAIEFALNEVQEKASGEIPADYRENFIENLLDEGACICGRDISEHDHEDAREEVRQYLERVNKLSDLEDKIMQGEPVLQRIGSKRSEFEEEQNSFNEKISELRGRIKDRNESIEEKKNRLEGSEVEEIKEKQRRLRELEEIEETLTEKKTRAEINVEKKEEELDEVSSELEDELDKKDEFKEMQEIYNFCSRTEEAAEEIKNEIMDEVREEIEDKTENWFFDLIWKEETYTSVEIDDNYNISLLDNHDRNSLNTLSAGETQTLALSFMAALNTVSGFYAPIIIDTPIGRISPNIKRNIAENLPSYMGDRQLILLVTGSEYTEEFRTAIKDDVSEEYEIEFSEDEHGSKAEVNAYGK